MSWIRGKIRLGAGLALIALALQVVVSFGHFHGIPAVKSGIAQFVSAPASDNRLDTDGATDLCAVCAVMAMAGTMLASAPPALPARQAHRRGPGFVTAAFIAPRAPFGAYCPRAPPLS